MLENILSLSTKKPEGSVYVQGLTLEEKKELYKVWALYNVETCHTFPTVWLPVPPEVAKIISEGPYETLPEAQCLKDVEEQIDKLITTLPNDAGLFGRLSTRSPKDAVMWNEEALEREVISCLEKINLKDKNAVSIVVWEGMKNAMKCHTGKEILRLLLQSDRSEKDCSREIERGDDYAMNLIVRSWVDIPISYEFRCFFTNRTINAITQYFNNCYFQEVVTNKEELEMMMLEEWDRLKDKLPFENGIVDFTVDFTHKKAYVIEFNPLDLFTGGALFDYYSDWDVIVGNKPREFRIVESLDGDDIKKELEGTVSSFGVEVRKAKQRQAQRLELEQQKKPEGEKRETESCALM